MYWVISAAGVIYKNRRHPAVTLDTRNSRRIILYYFVPFAFAGLFFFLVYRQERDDRYP